MGNRKQPFGYKMEFGEIVPQPQEAETVRSIYLQYLAGASFKQLAERLQTEDVPYDGDKTTPGLIQFHTLKNAVNPPFLGGFLISGTVAA